MLGGFGAMLDEPAALGFGQRCSAQRIFAGQPTAIEVRFKVGQRASFALVANTRVRKSGSLKSFFTVARSEV